MGSSLILKSKTSGNFYEQQGQEKTCYQEMMNPNQESSFVKVWNDYCAEAQIVIRKKGEKSFWKLLQIDLKLKGKNLKIKVKVI